MKKKRWLFLVLLISTLIISNTSQVLAYQECSEREVSLFAEEVEWYYKKIGGIMHKRLWSSTYGRWLTDWIPKDKW